MFTVACFVPPLSHKSKLVPKIITLAAAVSVMHRSGVRPPVYVIL